MYIHPLEAFGYYCILYSAPFVIPMHSYSFVLYMILMGLTGVLDHCGVKFSLPGIYDTTHHGKCPNDTCHCCEC
jgi:sterol desaturase/sphingolipid hydroxylase (fatty acid hydroxylase superfamily)